MANFLGPIGNLFNLIFTFPIFNALMVLYHLIGDFGLSIIVLTLIIKLVLFPLTLQQLKSMRATQALQPQLAEIRRKYAKDQQAQMQASQQLYKEYGINPVAGCLPLLIQMPVLYGLFFALENVVKVSGSSAARLQAINSTLYPFVPHFTTPPNLSLNWFTFINPAFHFSLAIPDPTHILPILAALATFIQLRMSQTRTQATTGKAGDPTAQSMKMMQFVMPFITLFIGWTFPAGLALYWTVSSVFQAVQQYFVTGWGELLVIPNLSNLSLASVLGSGTSTTSNSNGSGKATKNSNYTASESKSRSVAVASADTDEGTDSDTEGEETVSRQTRTTSRNTTSASARRRSSNTRRRSSNNTQKRNVSSR